MTVQHLVHGVSLCCVTLFTLHKGVQLLYTHLIYLICSMMMLMMMKLPILMCAEKPET